MKKSFLIITIVILLFTLTGLSACDGSDDKTENSKSDKSDISTDSDKSDEGKVADTDINDSDTDQSQESLDPNSSKEDLLKLAKVLDDRLIRLNRKERDLIAREQLVTKLEKTAANKTGEAKEIYKKVDDMLKKLSSKYEDFRKLKIDKMETANKKRLAEREVQIDHLVATVKGMQPESGAGLLMNMDIEDVVQVLKKLGARQTAGLFGQMPPAKAAELTAAMLGPGKVYDKELDKMRDASLDDITPADTESKDSDSADEKSSDKEKKPIKKVKKRRKRRRVKKGSKPNVNNLTPAPVPTPTPVPDSSSNKSTAVKAGDASATAGTKPAQSGTK